MTWLEEIKWGPEGLVPVTAQEAGTGRILMQAWMNREALLVTVREQRAVYWSRSRQRLWRKGEESGHVQQLHEIRLDCDGDALVLVVEQVGDRLSYWTRVVLYRRLDGESWQTVEPIVRDPSEIYRAPGSK